MATEHFGIFRRIRHIFYRPVNAHYPQAKQKSAGRVGLSQGLTELMKQINHRSDPKLFSPIDNRTGPRHVVIWVGPHIS